MKITALILLIFTSHPSFSKEHSLSAHEHGSIKVGMAIEKNLVEIDIDGPAESFLGFEYLPKTAKEKKLLNELEMQWTKNLESLIAFDKLLHCKVTEASFKQVIDNKESGSHSDIEAKAQIRCAKEVTGSDVTISLKKTFTHIKKISIEIIGTESKSVEITKSVQVFKI